MRSIFTKLFIVFFFNTSMAQNIKIEHLSNPSDFEKALISFEEYVYYDFDFVSDSGKKIYFQIIQKEFTHGKFEKEIIYFDSKTLPEVFKSDRIPFTILSKKVDDLNYKLMFKFYKSITSNRKYKTNSNEPNSFKIFVNHSQTFAINKFYLLGGIVKPVKVDENLYRDCDFNSALDKYQNWY